MLRTGNPPGTVHQKYTTTCRHEAGTGSRSRSNQQGAHGTGDRTQRVVVGTAPSVRGRAAAPRTLGAVVTTLGIPNTSEMP